MVQLFVISLYFYFSDIGTSEWQHSGSKSENIFRAVQFQEIIFIEI
jgi:hypothetical protein